MASNDQPQSPLAVSQAALTARWPSDRTQHLPLAVLRFGSSCWLDRVTTETATQHHDSGLTRRHDQRYRCAFPTRVSHEIDSAKATLTAYPQLISNCTRFPLSSRVSLVIPIMLPPGRAKLSTNPVATGSTLVTITMGIVLVACLATRSAGEAIMTSASTLSCTSSATRALDAFDLAFRVSVFDQYVFSLDVTEISQPSLKRANDKPLGSSEKSDARDFPRLLSLDGRAKRQEYGAKSHIRNVNFYTHASSLSAHACIHLITLSARASTLGGIVRPICFAVFRLIANSNFVGCSTGRSAGFAPLRILSTYVAARLKLSASSAE
jgi:hypothetical protein